MQATSSYSEGCAFMQVQAIRHPSENGGNTDLALRIENAQAEDPGSCTPLSARCDQQASSESRCDHLD